MPAQYRAGPWCSPVNTSPCHGEDRRFKSGRARLVLGTPVRLWRREDRSACKRDRARFVKIPVNTGIFCFLDKVIPDFAKNSSE